MNHKESSLEALIERVLAKTEEYGDCLMWTGAMTSKTVPVISLDGTTQPVRRALWSKMGKPIMPGRGIVASCGHAACVEPAHFEQVKRGRPIGSKLTPSHRANIATARRERSLLTIEDVRAIRAAEDRKAAIALGEAKGIGFSMVGKIVTHRHWKEVLHTPFAGLLR